jgi:hypothetical protein
MLDGLCDESLRLDARADVRGHGQDPRRVLEGRDGLNQVLLSS